MNNQKIKAKFSGAFLFSTCSLLLLVGEQLVSRFRKESLGLNPRVAGQDFSYNFLIFIPVIIATFILTVMALIKYEDGWKMRKKTGTKLTWFEKLSIVPALLPIVGILYVGFAIIYIIIKNLFAA